MRWIEPTASPSAIAPSARTSARWRLLASTSLMPGAPGRLDQRRERHPRRFARCHKRGERRFRQRLDGGDLPFCGCRVVRLTFDADEAPVQPARDRAGRAGAAKRVEHKIIGPRCCENDAGEHASGLLRRMQLFAVVVLEPFLAGT